MATVLVVEDNPANMTFATFLLTSVGHTVLSATSAETGLAIAREQQPNLILMDIQLPGMDGLEAIALLKGAEATRAIPVIALTALAMKGDEQRIRAAGCDGYIGKPMRYKEFLAAIAAQLARGMNFLVRARDDRGMVSRVAHILVIDDVDELRALMVEILTGAGHRVVDAGGGVQGLEMLRRDRPDLVLCDINMPGMDGFGVLRAIRTDPELATLPFVFLTSEAEVRAGMRSGADDYLMKPVTAVDLLAAVDARLARRDSTRREGERRVDEMRRTVVALLPHEIRTPLTTIIGSARLMQEFHGDFEPKDIEEMATGILKAAQRLHRMAENYILHADLEMQRSSLSSGAQPLAGSSGAADVEAAARETAVQRGRAADLDLALDDVAVPIAPAYVRKVTSELCDNAFKFSEAGQRVRVALTADARGTRLDVSDEGRGMTAEQVSEVGAFRQFDRGRYEQQGSGVGLALVRSIAEVSGGRLELISREGTTASVRWP